LQRKWKRRFKAKTIPFNSQAPRILHRGLQGWFLHNAIRIQGNKLQYEKNICFGAVLPCRSWSDSIIYLAKMVTNFLIEVMIKKNILKAKWSCQVFVELSENIVLSVNTWRILRECILYAFLIEAEDK
jgi:hypothetical protein